MALLESNQTKESPLGRMTGRCRRLESSCAPVGALVRVRRPKDDLARRSAGYARGRDKSITCSGRAVDSSSADVVAAMIWLSRPSVQMAAKKSA
jgi:hypothetical protein